MTVAGGGTNCGEIRAASTEQRERHKKKLLGKGIDARRCLKERRRGCGMGGAIFGCGGYRGDSGAES